MEPRKAFGLAGLPQESVTEFDAEKAQGTRVASLAGQRDGQTASLAPGASNIKKADCPAHKQAGKTERNDSMKDRNFGMALTFLCVGLGVGALTALMLAPRTGKQLRRSLKRCYEDAREVFKDFSDQASEAWDRGTEYAGAMREKVAPIGKAMGLS